MIRLWTTFLTRSECERLAHVLVSAGWTVGPLLQTIWTGVDTYCGHLSTLLVGHPSCAGTEPSLEAGNLIKQICLDNQLRFLCQIGHNIENGSSWWCGSTLPYSVKPEPKTVWERIEQAEAEAQARQVEIEERAALE